MYRYIGKTRINLNDCNGNYRDITIQESKCNVVVLKRLINNLFNTLKDELANYGCSLAYEIVDSHLKTIILTNNRLSNNQLDNISSVICEYYLNGPGENLNLTVFETFLEDNQENGWIADIEHKRNNEIYFILSLDSDNVQIAPLLNVKDNPSININNIIDIVVQKLRDYNLDPLSFSEKVKGVNDYDELLCIAGEYVDLY